MKVDEERLAQDWLHEVEIADSYFELKWKVFKMMAGFESMGGNHLGRTNIAKNLIVLSPAGVKQIYSVSYRKDPKAQALEK